MTGPVREGQCVLTTAYRTIILIMRSNSDKHYTKQQIILCCVHCLVNSWHLQYKVEEPITGRQATDVNMAIAHCMLDIQVYTHTHTHTNTNTQSIFIIYCFPTTTMVTRTRPGVVICTLPVLSIRKALPVCYFTNSPDIVLGYHLHVLNSSICRLK